MQMAMAALCAALLVVDVAGRAAPHSADTMNAPGQVAPLRINGMVAAVFSPFDDTGELNLSAVHHQHAYLNATGVQWVFTCGTTGESLSLTMAERKSILGAWVSTGANVIAHVGAESIKDARELAVNAQHAGAKAIAAMPPTFFKPASAAALAATIAHVCAAAPALPCYYYHIPSMTGVSLPMLDFVRHIEPLADNFAGVKYTGMYTYPGMMDAQRVLNYAGGKYEVLSGREEMMLEALSIGITGHVGSQFNFAGDLFGEIIRLFSSEGLTPISQPVLRNLQLVALDLIDAWQPVGLPGQNAAMFFMVLAGVHVGDARLPSVPLDERVKGALRLSFNNFCNSIARHTPLAGLSPKNSLELAPASLEIPLRMCAANYL
mmetsp:Transcript_36087/g.75945  ORF Transcript_36087/g.75945 Transcript_36087/m.75945 type:complete len:377 (-) Transcript_36087:356-1486(-)